MPTVTEPTASVEVQPGTSEKSEFFVSGDDLIIVPDNDQSEQTEQEKPEEQTEYTPPEGLDEDQTPIL